MSLANRIKIPQGWKRFIPIVLSLLLLLLTYLFGTEISAFTGFPKGYDAYGHMGLAKIVRDSFPHIYWNSYWDSGTTLLVRSYPPMTYLLSAFISKAFSWSLPQAFIVLTMISILLIVLGIFSFVFLLTKQSIPALLAGFLLISSPAFWAYVIEGGLYPRVFGTAPLVLSWVFVWLYLQEEGVKKGERAKKRRFWYLAAIMSLFLTVTLHQLSALLGLLSVGFLISIWIKTKREILVKTACLFAPVFLLSAFYFLPLLTVFRFNPPSWGEFPGQSAYNPVSLARLFKPETTVASVPILLIPLAFVSVFLRFGQKIKKESQKKVIIVSKIMAVFAIISLAYALGLFKGYFHGVYPHHFLFYFVLFLATFVGVSFGLTQSVAPLDVVLVLSICAATILSWQKQIPALKQRVVDYSKIHQKTFQQVVVEPNEKNYRFGNASEVVAGWFNFKNLAPQTRDYYPFGPLYPHWQYFLEKTVWGDEENYNETDFLLDWYGIKNFYVGLPRGGIQRASGNKFAKRLEYERVNQNEFVYQKASPILSATNTPTVALISDQPSYDVFVWNLALGNTNSQVLIPLKMGGQLSDLERENLSQSDLIVLYGFKGQIEKNTVLKLAEYVKEGGRLLIEKNKESYSQEELPDPWPVERTTPGNMGEDWQWEKSESGWDGEFGEGEWGVSLGIGVKNWAQPLIFFQNQPVVVSGQLGKGRVIWSGLNLPYHLQLSKSSEEIKFFQNLIFDLLGEAKGTPIDFKTSFINNQRREIEIREKAKGVLFKESYFPNWKAQVIATGRKGKKETRELRVYPAGLMMMYVPLPKTSFPIKVVLLYKLSFLENLGLGISLVGFGILIGLLVTSQKSFLKLPKRSKIRKSQAEKSRSLL